MSMKQKTHAPLTPVLAIGAAALGVSAFAGLAFAMWIDNGPQIFMTMVEAGLSCF